MNFSETRRPRDRPRDVFLLATRYKIHQDPCLPSDTGLRTIITPCISNTISTSPINAKLILQDISASLAMSIFSILVVVTIFLITYRNLMEEKRLSNLKTDFINNMTHELKTPLATITVAGKTLEMEKIRRDDAKILETAKLIGKQSVHLNQLINMILEISMWERTQFQLDKKKVDIEEIMNDIVASFKSGSGNDASLTPEIYILTV